MIEQKDQWANLHSLIKMDAERQIKSTGESQKETRYYISSLQTNAQQLNRCVRSRWKIENSLHWVLDVAFHEDHSRKGGQRSQ